jgi:branched-subunit amino acid transport protein
MSVTKVRRSLGRIWRWPALLGALTVFGLLSALIGQTGFWWAWSWIALATLLAVIVCCAGKSLLRFQV